MPLLCILFSFLFWYIFNFINLCKFLLKKLIRLLASRFPKFWISTSSFCLSYIVCIVSVSISTFYLGCTDAAKRPPHLRSTHKGHLCLRVRAASSFFFFCFTTCINTRKIRSIRTNQGQIGPYRSQPPIPTPTGQFNPKFKKKKKKVRNAPFGRNNNKRCKMHRLDKNNKTLYHLQSAALSFLTSHLQLSLTLWSLIFVLHATACYLCSPSPLSHTISLSHSHNLTHILGDPLSSLKLKYQSQAFNLSFSQLSHALTITQCVCDSVI